MEEAPPSEIRLSDGDFWKKDNKDFWRCIFRDELEASLRTGGSEEQYKRLKLAPKRLRPSECPNLQFGECFSI